VAQGDLTELNRQYSILFTDVRMAHDSLRFLHPAAADQALVSAFNRMRDAWLGKVAPVSSATFASVLSRTTQQLQAHQVLVSGEQS
jgi:hypothetical protein